MKKNRLNMSRLEIERRWDQRWSLSKKKQKNSCLFHLCHSPSPACIHVNWEAKVKVALFAHTHSLTHTHTHSLTHTHALSLTHTSSKSISPKMHNSVSCWILYYLIILGLYLKGGLFEYSTFWDVVVFLLVVLIKFSVVLKRLLSRNFEVSHIERYLMNFENEFPLKNTVIQFLDMHMMLIAKMLYIFK